MAKVNSQIRLEPTDFAKLKIVAAAQSRSMNSMLEYLVRTEIARYERENGEIQIPSKG